MIPLGLESSTPPKFTVLLTALLHRAVDGLGSLDRCVSFGEHFWLSHNSSQLGEFRVTPICTVDSLASLRR